MPSPSVAEQTEDVLDEVLRITRQEYENPYPVLSETDRNRIVEEEESLRAQLKATAESDSNSWRGLLRLPSLPSSQVSKCLKNAQGLRRRVREDINAKLRTRLSGVSGTPLVGSTPRPASTIVTSPLNMRYSDTASELGVSADVNPAVQNHRDYTFDISEAVNSSLKTSSESSDQSRDSSSRRYRRSPPPPPSPPPRRVALSTSSRPSSDSSSDSASDSLRRSYSARRPAPPPPQSPRRTRTSRLPTNASFSSNASVPLDPAMIASISRLTQQLASTVTEGLSTQTQGHKGVRRSNHVIKTNCLDIQGSNVDGVTLNNGGSQNSGAVIHKTLAPPRSPRPTPPS